MFAVEFIARIEAITQAGGGRDLVVGPTLQAPGFSILANMI